MPPALVTILTIVAIWFVVALSVLVMLNLVKWLFFVSAERTASAAVAFDVQTAPGRSGLAVAAAPALEVSPLGASLSNLLGEKSDVDEVRVLADSAR